MSMEAIHSDGSLTVANNGFFMASGQEAVLRYSIISVLSALDLYDKTGMEVRKNYLKANAAGLERLTGEKILTPSNRLTASGRSRMREICIQIRQQIEGSAVVYKKEE